MIFFPFAHLTRPRVSEVHAMMAIYLPHQILPITRSAACVTRVKAICGAVCGLVRSHEKLTSNFARATSNPTSPHSNGIQAGPTQANHNSHAFARLISPVAREAHTHTTPTLAAPRVPTPSANPLARYPSAHPRRSYNCLPTPVEQVACGAMGSWQARNSNATKSAARRQARPRPWPLRARGAAL